MKILVHLKMSVLSRYERLILFTGPQQEFIRFPAVTYAGDISVSVFRVSNVSKNNVDFHLVFELGRLSATAPEETIFFILSRMIKAMMASLPSYAGRGDDVVVYHRLALQRNPKAAPMVISNDEVLHLTNKVQSLSKKSAGTARRILSS